MRDSLSSAMTPARETRGQRLLREERERSCKGRCSKLKRSCKERGSKLLNGPLYHWKPVLGLSVFAAVVALVILIILKRHDTQCWAQGAPPFPAPVLDRPGSPAPVATPYDADCSAHHLCKGLKGACCPTPAGTLLDCCGEINSSVSIDPFHGMCYSPMPAKEQVKESFWSTDDCMAKWAESMWGANPFGRDDLASIKKLGANVVRMYGFDATAKHGDFLNRAAQLGLGVMVGMSNYPYLQDPTGSCAKAPDYDCRDKIEDEYTKLLRGGLSLKLPDGTRVYHPAVQAIVLMNEPELSIGTIVNPDGTKVCHPDSNYTKAIISALDGALEAERKLNISPNSKSRMPPFAMVYSIDVCKSCTSNKAHNKAGDRPVGEISFIPFVYDFVLASLNPESFGYKTQKHDLRAALQNRIAFGFNTDLLAKDICKVFLADIGKTPLASLPFFAGEYNPKTSASLLTKDLQILHAEMETGTSSCIGEGKSLKGANFFEFQVSYWKGPKDDQLRFGLFELGDKKLGTTCAAKDTNWNEYTVWCLRKKRDSDGQSCADSLAKFYGGSLVNDSGC